VLTWTDTDGKTELDFVWKETQHLSQEEFETKMKEAGIMFAADLPEGDLGSIRYFSQAENTGIELYYFAGATWINLNSRIFELVPEGTIIIPIEWPTGEDEPAPEESYQERLDKLLHAGTEDPLNEALISVIQKYNHQEQSEEIISLTSFKILEQATLVACGADEESSYTEEQVLLVALYQEFDPELGGMEPVTERFSLMVVKFEALENGTYDETFFWQKVNSPEWDYEEVRKWFPLGVSGQFHDFSIGGRGRLHYELQNIHYSALSRSGIIDAQWEIRSLFDTMMDCYYKLGEDFGESCLDEYNRILCYGDEALRFVLHEFMYGGQVDYRGVLLEEFLLRLMPETSIDLYTETPQEYFDSWRRFMFREYDRLGEEKAFELYPRMPIFLEVMAEYNTPDESIDESVSEGVYNTPDDSIAE